MPSTDPVTLMRVSAGTDDEARYLFTSLQQQFVNLRRGTPAPLAGTEPLADLGHLTIFAAMGCFLRLGRRADPWPAQLLLLVALGGMAEILQYLAVMRSSSLGDWAANAAGGLVGWLLALAWLAWRQEGQFATQRRSSTTVPPQPAKQCR
mgnify:CR=1 FL=1